MVHKVLFLFHLLGFAAYLGAGFAQQQFMARSALGGVAPAVRDEYERLAAAIVTRIELPALATQVATGAVFLLLSPIWLTYGWMHGKLTCVLALVVLSHLEMMNARKIVKARTAGGEQAVDEIATRKARHAMFGTIGSLAVVALLGLVAYGMG
jgi:uncharacterized membrane protein